MGYFLHLSSVYSVKLKSSRFWSALMALLTDYTANIYYPASVKKATLQCYYPKYLMIVVFRIVNHSNYYNFDLWLWTGCTDFCKTNVRNVTLWVLVEIICSVCHKDTQTKPKYFRQEATTRICSILGSTLSKTFATVYAQVLSCSEHLIFSVNNT